MAIMNPDHVGKKIKESRYRWQVVDWLYEGYSVAKCCRELEKRFGYRISVPSMTGFKRNFYLELVETRKRDNDDFKNKQVSKIKTFLDEAHGQEREVKKTITALNRHIKEIEGNIDFSSKFNKLYRTSIDNFVEEFDAENPHTLFNDEERELSTEEQALMELRDSLRDDSGSLAAYITAHAPQQNIRLLLQLRKQVLEHRMSIEKIHHNIFKSYRDYSIMQEVMVIFEKYNDMIVQEFFSDKEKIDRNQYNTVRRRIFVLYNEIQGRYQSYEGPVSQPMTDIPPTTENNDKEVKKAKKPNKKGKRATDREPKPKAKEPDFMARVRAGGTVPDSAPDSNVDTDVDKFVESLGKKLGIVTKPKPVDPKRADLDTVFNKIDKKE